MGLDALVTDLLKVADSLTGDLQPKVLHSAWLSQTDAGTPTYGSAVSRAALIEKKQRQVRTADGQLVTVQATVTFLRPTVVGPKDKIVLPDGTTGPIITTDAGLVSKTTSKGYYTEVYLG